MIHGLNVRNRPAAIALAAVALAVGAVFIAFGIVLLLSLAVVGTAIGTGVLLYRALTGRKLDRAPVHSVTSDLDPSLEVQPATRVRGSVASPKADKPTS
jgi:hypothetical protein